MQMYVIVLPHFKRIIVLALRCWHNQKSVAGIAGFIKEKDVLLYISVSILGG